MDFIELHKNCGLKVGDKVIITGTAAKKEHGWSYGWNDAMTSKVGQIFTIKDDHGTRFTLVETGCVWPSFALQKIDQKFYEKKDFKNGPIFLKGGNVIIKTKSELLKEEDFQYLRNWSFSRDGVKYKNFLKKEKS